ncbi:hypothetical protein K402DRAFT_118167 [Aulographum hederae CBS 113979]|uniref:Uncharacterized protein n=1 Tax=Aulographum hederae CBS 113979 TaxID=1176131 RepID=A0A6G1GWD3_9PEZI|nr:hypothetical protein K402DRAFT_118167 [Aulographum hederae CBS 113979]
MSTQSQTPHQKTSLSDQFLRGASDVPGGNEMWAPVRWIAELVQTLIAVIFVMIGKAFKAIFEGSDARSKRRERTHGLKGSTREKELSKDK